MSNTPSARRHSVRKPQAIARTSPLLLAFAASTTRAAHASIFLLTTNCSLSGNPLKCHLLGVLNFLYAVAAVLAIVLVVVAALAVRSYRRLNRSKGRP